MLLPRAIRVSGIARGADDNIGLKTITKIFHEGGGTHG